MTYQPKGSRPLRITPQQRVSSIVANHYFQTNPVDVYSCLICNLPERNWRHHSHQDGAA